MIKGENSDTGDRTLLGHTFHYPRFVANAFTAANFYVGSSIELYSQSKVVSNFDAGGVPKTLEYDRELGFVRLRFGTDFRPAEIFTFGVNAEYLAEVGANEETLFLYGGKTGFDIQPNMKFRLARGTEAGAQLALQPFVMISGGIRAVPQGLLRVLADQIQEIAVSQERTQCLVEADFNCAFDRDANLGESIKLTQRRYGGGASLNYAQALNRHLGGQMSVSLGGASATTSATFLDNVASSHMLFKFGISPAINLHPIAPLGTHARVSLRTRQGELRSKRDGRHTSGRGRQRERASWRSRALLHRPARSHARVDRSHRFDARHRSILVRRRHRAVSLHLRGAVRHALFFLAEPCGEKPAPDARSATWACG
jgi:hypothetical protein